MKQEKFYDIVRYPCITEKTTLAKQENKYVFVVANEANKLSIKKAVENLFKVDVVSVNIINVKGKTKLFRGTLGKRKDVKKAIVTLKAGQNIDEAIGI